MRCPSPAAAPCTAGSGGGARHSPPVPRQCLRGSETQPGGPGGCRGAQGQAGSAGSRQRMQRARQSGGGSAGHPKTPSTAGGPPRGQRWDPHAHAAVPPPCTPKQGRAYLCKLSPGQAGAGGKRGEPWSVRGAPQGGGRTPQHPRAGEGLPEAGGLRTPPPSPPATVGATCHLMTLGPV